MTGRRREAQFAALFGGATDAIEKSYSCDGMSHLLRGMPLVVNPNQQSPGVKHFSVNELEVYIHKKILMGPGTGTPLKEMILRSFRPPNVRYLTHPAP